MFWSGRQLEQEPFHGAAVQLLRRQIHLGQLQPHEQLPPERRLSETLGIARVTLREAFKVLEDGEYIVSKRGKTGGTFVANEGQINEIARRNLVKDPGNAWRMLEYLRANLLIAVECAMDRRSPGDLAALEATTQRLSAASSGAKFREIRFSFLTGIGIASANPYFTDAITLALDGLFHPISEDNFQSAKPFLLERFTEMAATLKRRDMPAGKRLCVLLLDDIAQAVNDGMNSWASGRPTRDEASTTHLL